MPRVCFYNIAAGVGGAERSLIGIVRGLLRSRYEPLVVTPVEGDLTERLRMYGVPVFVRPLPGIIGIGRYSGARDYLQALRGAFLVGYYRWWASLLREQRVDIVHTNSVKCTFLTAPMRLFRPRPRIVWHIRDVMRGRRRFFPIVDTLGCYVPDAIIANSDYTAAQFMRCRSRVVRLYNGLNLENYRRGTPEEKADFRNRWNIPQDRRIVGILGVLTPLKGHRVFLEAAREILKRHADTHFVVVGDEIYDTAGHRGYRRSLEDYARSLGIDNHVTFTGFVNKVERVLSTLDVAVQPSVEPESFGRVVVEAQASGVPVVASRIGGIPEIIRNNAVGTLVTPGSVAELVHGVCRYLESEDLYRRTSEAEYNYAREHFAIATVVDGLSTLYDRLLQGGASS